MIPSYNQRARTQNSAAVAEAYLREHFPGAAELIVVDDGSDPGTRIQAGDLAPGITLVTHDRNLGKGGAIRSGVARTRGDYVIFTDSDLPFSLAPVATTLDWLRADADIVIGDRLLPQSVGEAGVPAIRRLSSVLFTAMVQRVVGLAFADTQCGYKGYRGDVARSLFGSLEITSFAFDVEILVKAQRLGYRVRRQPVRLLHNEDSSVRLSRHAPQVFTDTLRIAWRARRGRYG